MNLYREESALFNAFNHDCKKGVQCAILFQRILLSINSHGNWIRMKMKKLQTIWTHQRQLTDWKQIFHFLDINAPYQRVWNIWLFGAFILGTSSASITSPYIIEQTTWNGVNTTVILLMYLYIYLFFIMLISCFTCIEFLQIGGPNNENVGKFLGFSVYVSNLTLLEDRVLCFHDFHFDKYTIPAVITLNCTMHGRYIEFQNNRTRSSFPADYSRYASNDLCEFEVYGE